MAEHSHEHNRDHAGHGSHKQHTHGGHKHDGHSGHTVGHSHQHASIADMKKTLAGKARRIPGLIYLERQIHDGAIVISAALTYNYTGGGINTLIAGELENAAGEIEGMGGIVGHIKASVSTTSVCTISVAGEHASEREADVRSCRIQLAAIVFMVEAKDAETIIRKALTAVRARMKEGNHP